MKTSNPRRGCGKCRHIDCAGQCNLIELPRLRSKVKVTYPGGYDGKCPDHGGHSWSSNPELAGLVCAQRDNGRQCGKNIQWTECPPAEFVGWYILRINENDVERLYLHPLSPYGPLADASCFVTSHLTSLEVLASP